jgi:dihydrofolate reductase
MEIAIVVAVTQNGVIGFENRLPWHLPADLRHFKQLTTNHTVVMGRKTFESIGKPLPNRQNIVISRQTNFHAEGCLVFTNLIDALQLAKNQQAEKVFVIGGAEIYQIALPFCTHLYMTHIHATIQGDAFFELDKKTWHEITKEHREADEKNEYVMDFVKYKK